ncbi:membrane protein [Anaerocolumna cellulosilytica]|uniref:Membrane protein n=1 Tax=Anaerocolumna cellulosilytica TaxID=433286 RepID=A0A6S6R2W7_9FIRM|nr:YjbE family putative metal transport protein [Anaerocolumna cellulosilytica]MBB5196037.1 YjbE family integral membrane protein [Anaerocolumna cellulosilytica]BCJ93660.1 membrane protein [Anaerocolumna cellulosilytica]
MQDFMQILIKMIHIMLLNIILSFDSISVIAVMSRKLPKKYRKKAYMTGLSISVFCTIFFTSIISIIMEIQWLPVQLLGGILLLKMTYELLKQEHTMNASGDENIKRLTSAMSLPSAIAKITIISLSFSFDNILAIAGAADGNIEIITFGLLLSLPLILTTCKYILRLIERQRIFLYISGAILIYTAIEMILSYQVIAPYIPRIIASLIPRFFSVFVVLYGLYMVKKSSSTTQICESKDTKAP